MHSEQGSVLHWLPLQGRSTEGIFTDYCIVYLKLHVGYYLHVNFCMLTFLLTFVLLLQGQFLWDNLIDHDRSYHFEIELEVATETMPVYYYTT